MEGGPPTTLLCLRRSSQGVTRIHRTSARWEPFQDRQVVLIDCAWFVAGMEKALCLHVHHREHLFERHACGMAHSVILKGTFQERSVSAMSGRFHPSGSTVGDNAPSSPCH